MRLFAVLLTGVLIAGCSGSDEPAAEPVLRPVRVAVVSTNNGLRERAFTGVSRSTQESRLSFRVSGTVVEVPVQVGDRLAAGDLIARLNRSTFDLTVQQAEASLAQASANLRNADSSYSRVKELYENSNASRNDLDSARASAESALAQVNSARKSLEIAELDRSYTGLVAASDCTVASLDIERNESVSAGNPVAQVNCGSGIEVRLGVPESLIAGLERGKSANVRFSAIPGRTFAGTITEIGVASGGSVATFPVVVALNESAEGTRPSMAAEVVFEFKNSQSGVLVIPAVAVINDERGSFVFVAEPDGQQTATIQRKKVEVGELRENGIEVLEGLSDGDRVVTAGITVIREGQSVLLPGT